MPKQWSGVNIEAEPTRVHTGKYAVKLGAGEDSDEPASLAQDVNVMAGSVYQLLFSAMGSGELPRPVDLIWLTSDQRPAGDAAPPILIPPTVLPQFVQFSRIIGPVPQNASSIRITFNKPGPGYLIVDDVSLFKVA